jgi:hypothetical protein
VRDHADGLDGSVDLDDLAQHAGMDEHDVGDVAQVAFHFLQIGHRSTTPIPGPTLEAI